MSSVEGVVEREVWGGPQRAVEGATVLAARNTVWDTVMVPTWGVAEGILWGVSVKPSVESAQRRGTVWGTVETAVRGSLVAAHQGAGARPTGWALVEGPTAGGLGSAAWAVNYELNSSAP